MNTNTKRLLWIATLSPAFLLTLAGAAFAGGDGRHAAAAAHHAAAAQHGCAAGAAHAARPADATIVRVRGEDTNAEHSWSDGKNDVKILREGGKVRVVLNGEEIMKLDDAELFEAEIAGAHEHAAQAQDFARAMRERVRRMPPGQVQAFGFGGETPKVMIGVTMETATEAQAEVPDGVDASQSTVITRVVEGLPAEKAGLKEGDIVVKVNGESSAAPDDIREAIKDKDAGDKLKLRVVRDGTEQDVVIALAAYDGGKLGSPRVWGFGQGGDSMLGSPHGMSDDDLKRLEKFRTELEKTSAELQRLGVQLGNSTDPKERERLGAQMAELGSKMATLGTDMGDVTGGGGQWRFLAPGQDNFDLRRLPRMRLERGMEGGAPKAFVFTPEDGQSQAGEADRIQKLDERLERLEKLLEKVVEEKEKSKN